MTITFDVSDPSLLDMKLDFFDDISFKERLDVTGTNDASGFNIHREAMYQEQLQMLL